MLQYKRFKNQNKHIHFDLNILPLKVRVNLGVTTMKEWVHTPKTAEL